MGLPPLMQAYNIQYYFNKRSSYLPLIMGCSPGDISEEPVTQDERKKGGRKSCDVGEATKGLENEL